MGRRAAVAGRGGAAGGGQAARAPAVPPPFSCLAFFSGAHVVKFSNIENTLYN